MSKDFLIEPQIYAHTNAEFSPLNDYYGPAHSMISSINCIGNKE